MKFYKAGRRIRDLDELEIGKVYSVCGVVGELSLASVPNGDNVYKFTTNGEKIQLYIGREELMDRVYLGMVYAIKCEFKPREKTMAKLYSSIKK